MTPCFFLESIIGDHFGIYDTFEEALLALSMLPERRDFYRIVRRDEVDFESTYTVVFP